MATKPISERLIDAQISSWVSSLARSHQIEDPDMLKAARLKVKHHIARRMEEEGLGLDALTGLLAEALKTLNAQFEQIKKKGG
jgi:hypothetical protein